MSEYGTVHTCVCTITCTLIHVQCLLTVSFLCPPPPLQSGLPPDAEPGVERDGLDAAQVLWAELNRTDQPVEFAVQASSHASFGAPRGQQRGGREGDGREEEDQMGGYPAAAL